MVLSGKKILLGITGSIAAYKAVLILRQLQSEGADVTVVMTSAAARFIGPATLEALSGHPVHRDLFESPHEMVHLSLAQQADAILVAPASADFLARVTLGLSNDLLLTVVLAARCPVLMAPAMDAVMWENPTVQDHVMQLQDRGMTLIQPDHGPLASGLTGPGRLATESQVLSAVCAVLAVREDWKGEVVLVTAGPTREPIDLVRFLSNRSSGKMGYALARAARDRGARVILVSGPTALPFPSGVEVFQVETSEEMRQAVRKFFSESTVLIMAAAVADWKSVRPFPRKLKKSDPSFHLDLIPTPDILEEAAAMRQDQSIVGFSAETDDLYENAVAKMKRKGMDLVVANDVTQPGAGFETDTNVVTLIDAGGKVEKLPVMSKDLVSQKILDRIFRIRNHHA